MSEAHTRKMLLQEAQYEFPYHYIPYLANMGSARRHRMLRWGFEYLCYQHHIRDTVMQLTPKSALEIGCGDGYLIGSLADDVEYCVGADFSAKAIGFARAFHPDVDFHIGDASDIEGEFDVVAAVEVLEHIPDKEVSDFLRILFNRARPGGHIVVSVPSVVLPLSNKHFRHYTSELLREQVLGACPDADVESEEYVCRIPRWMATYNKLTANRYWFLDVGLVSDWIWRRLWKSHRVGDENTGRHVVGVFRKPSP